MTVASELASLRTAARNNSFAVSTVSGWRVIMSYYPHVSLPGAPDARGLYLLSAQLFPVGRSSTTEDWEMLGRIAAAGVGRSDLRTEEVTLTPAQQTPPGAPHYFGWLEDGHLSEVQLAALRRAVRGASTAFRSATRRR